MLLVPSPSLQTKKHSQVNSLLRSLCPVLGGQGTWTAVSLQIWRLELVTSLGDISNL